MSLNLTIYLCYYLRLNDKIIRNELCEQLDKIFGNFLKVPKNIVQALTEQMVIGKGIALNRALKENLFTCYTCVDNLVPLIIVGKPGTGKSLSCQILYNTLVGEFSKSKIFQKKGKLYTYYYQGSEASTSKGIKEIFQKAIDAKKQNINNKIIPMVIFDEMGLAERSNNNPLKVMHHLLEKEEDETVPFVGISNWRLDAAKINRALNLLITDYDKEDYEETSIFIAKDLDEDLSNRYKNFFITLANVYHEYISNNQNNYLRENKDFHGNRDFYNLIKTAMYELISKRKDLEVNEKKVLTEIGLFSLNRNFGGLEIVNSTITNIFKKLYGYNFDESVEINKKFSVLDAIKKNLLNTNTRYLMLISEGNDGNDIVKYLIRLLNKNYIELIGSKYKKDKNSEIYIDKILNKIINIISTDSILILKDLKMIYPSLYDLFNQNFSSFGEKNFTRIAFEHAKRSSEVNKKFHAIVIVNKKQIQRLKLDPPFLNRFEKHIIHFTMLLEERDIEIAKNIVNYLKLISTFNNNEELKINLENLLINCKQHNIESLIFKIKEDNKNKDWLQKKGELYDKSMAKEIFKKIVPLFCQDIIAAIINLDLSQKYYNQIVLDIYKKAKYNNFFSFFKDINKRKNIIYTFSKATGEFIDEENNIKNKFGVFNKNSTLFYMIESIESENDLDYILSDFSESKEKNLLIFRFTDKDLKRMSFISYIISAYEKKNNKLLEKLIIFLVHKIRISKKNQDKEPSKYKEEETISFIDDDYYQIFIDNLQGNEELDILDLIQKNDDELTNKYIYNYNFIENKIFNVLNYINCQILNETEDCNSKNFYEQLSEKIKNNKIIKEYLISNLKEQRKSIINFIKDIFLKDIIEINDIDFFEVINTKLNTFFCQGLLNIIFYSLEEEVLNQILLEKNYSILIENNFLYHLICQIFKMTKFKKNIKMKYNSNKLIIYNGLQIPKSKANIEHLLNYIENEILTRYKENEKLLREVNKNENKNTIVDTYNSNYNRIKKNIETIINHKCLLIKAILDPETKIELKQMLLDDYLKYFIIKFTEKRKIRYKMAEKLLSLLFIIIKVKLNENINQKNDFSIFKFKYSMDEFIEIILFTQGYREDINNIFEVYIEIGKYNENFDEIIYKILSENKMNYEISSRNEEQTKLVNICFFKLIESIIRGILIYSIELLEKDRAKFIEYISSFVAIEAIIQKINRTYFLFSKEIYNLRTIIKIDESNKFISDDLYKKIIENLLRQSMFLYDKKYQNLYKTILELISIINENFKKKDEKYINLLFFIYYHQYKNIFQDDIRFQLLESFFSNDLLLKKSKYFLYLIFKDLRPELAKEKSEQNNLLDNFLNLNKPKLQPFSKIINICNKIQSNEFNEILLFFFEEQCQVYFSTIIRNHKNNFTSDCCNGLLLNLSLEYFNKSIEYLLKQNNNVDNNILKLFSIAYIKIYCYYYVYIIFNHSDKCDFKEINRNINYLTENSNKKIIKMINIYILRLFCKNYPNFDKFIKGDLYSQNIKLDNDLAGKLRETQENNKKNNYIFEHSFISIKNFENYNNFVFNIENGNINMNDINKNFDTYYCFLVNKLISFLYGKEQNEIVKKMLDLYKKTYENINMGKEGKILYKYLLDYELFQKEIKNKISENLNQNDFEILLYSLRFILNTQATSKNNNFYNNILKSNAYNFIQNNYIPGSFPIMNEYMKSYYTLTENFKRKDRIGYYICKNCGYLYEVAQCTFPTFVDKCPNGHDIGGNDHKCIKKDIRVFCNKEDKEELFFLWNFEKEWLDSFISLTLQEFKENYFDKNISEPQKGIVKNYSINYFEKSFPIRNLNNITFRILNFILYSYLLGSYILNNVTKEEANSFLIEYLVPQSLFGVIKKNWELLRTLLEEIGFESPHIFINMIFDDVIQLINDFEFSTTQKEFNNFEMKVDAYITKILSEKENINELNNNYNKMNTSLINFDPYSIREIIQSNFDPLIYDQNEYPNIQYFSISNEYNYETFKIKFNLSEENKINYPLIHLLIDKDSDITRDAINLQNLDPINKLSNILLQIYSFKLKREDAKKVTLKEKVTEISDKLSELYQEQSFNEVKFEKNYIKNFINSWNIIKNKAIQYKCRNLKNPLDIDESTKLSYFLIDNGEVGFGMFLASAYEQMICWQNKFIDYIIDNNAEKGIHNSYVSLLKQETAIQDATKSETLNINKNIFKEFYILINQNSMRNIFTPEGKINYKNYNDIKYDYDYIEKELGKKILTGVRKFKNNCIRFITYLYEGFQGRNTSIMLEVNEKYPQKELSQEKKNLIKEFLKVYNTKQFYTEMFSSIQLIMNYIIKDYYNPNILISQIIDSLPKSSLSNQKIKDFFKNKFSINTILSIYEYFELLCWDQIKNSVAELYNLDLEEETKKYIIEYFDNNKNKKKLINKQNFTEALRKLMSRYLIGTKQDSDFNEKNSLSLYINKYEFWEKEITENEAFETELKEVCPENILISNCKKLFNILEGDIYVNKAMGKCLEKNAGLNNEEQEKDFYNSNQNAGEREWGID